MRINHNISALNTYRQLLINESNTAKSMEKLSSGTRINRAADDAAGLSISEKMRGQIRGLNQAVRNAQDGISYIQTAEGACNEVSDMLVRMKELEVQYANGTYNAEDQANITAEFDALKTAIGEVKTSTMFNGVAVLGTSTDIKYGQDATLTVTVAASTFDASALAIGGGVAAIDSVIDAVNTDRATYGAQQNQLEHVVNNLSTTAENIQAAESRIRDVDMAKEMMEFTKNSILNQAATAMLAQANMQPQNVLDLLK